MTRKELEKYVGKYVSINNESSFGFLSLCKTKDYINIICLDVDDDYWKEREEEFVLELMVDEYNNTNINDVHTIEERNEKDDYWECSIFEYFGHELKGWLSKLN